MSAVDHGEDLEWNFEDSRPSPAVPNFLSEDLFSNEDSQQLFHSIDQLRKCGAGQDLEVPQFVIVGKHSAGKSRLLQRLTGTPFPSSAAYTRFPLRIVSRRTAPGTEDRACACIKPGDGQIMDFRQEISSFNKETFGSLIENAGEAMGLAPCIWSRRRYPNSYSKNCYSSKVLEIEFSGPNRSHFSILDLPGILSDDFALIRQRHKLVVREMVTSYLNKPENIIIYVVDASGGVWGKDILPLARDVDSSRIVGVFTKCDLADFPNEVVKHANNTNEIYRKRRWYVVHNPESAGCASADRDLEERAFFNQAPWSKIPEEQRGTTNLKKHLANLLCRRILGTFPDILNTVTELLDAERLCRNRMGVPRFDHLVKQTYLMRIVDNYHILALQGLQCPSVQENFMNLRRYGVDAKLTFEKNMKEEGHSYPFTNVGKCLEIGVEEASVHRLGSDLDACLKKPSNPLRRGPANSLDTTPTRGMAVRRRGLYTFSPSPGPGKQEAVQVNETALYVQIRGQINSNRGEVLPGTLNPTVLKTLLRMQSSKWEDLGDKYLQGLVTITKEIAKLTFDKACQKSDITRRAQAGLDVCLSRFFEDSRHSLRQKLRRLCDKNETYALQIDTDEFLLKTRQAQIIRFSAALHRYKQSNPASAFVKALISPDAAVLAAEHNTCESWAIIDNNHIEALFDEIHPAGAHSQNIEDEIHDRLKAAYELALRNFIYDVSHNIAEPFLHRAATPFEGRLSEEDIDQLGQEDENVIEARKEVDERIARLEMAARIARNPWEDAGEFEGP